MSYHAVFDAAGLPTAFYSDALHTSIPAGAVAITDAQWQNFVDHSGSLVWANGGIAPYVAPAPSAADIAALQTRLCADIDAQAETQRLKYITGGSGQAMVYLQKQTQAAQALSDPAATAQKYLLLASEIGITVDPLSHVPATDVLGVARAVAATVNLWLPIAAAIDAMRLKTKAAINAATTAPAAQAAHDAVVWTAPT